MIEPTSNAALYGKGVFTTLVFVGGQPVFWDRHVRRLLGHANAVGIEAPAADVILDQLKTAIAESHIANGRARVSLFDLDGSPIWSNRGGSPSSVEIIVAPHRVLPDTFRIKLSDFDLNSRSPLAGLKTCNYLENLMALEDAKRDGFDEAVRVNELGEIASGACSNVFWVRDGRIFSPALDTGCLAGTTREFVIENFDVEEVNSGPATIMEADAIILTSAGIGARRASFDGNPKPDHTADRIINAVSEVYGIR